MKFYLLVALIAGALAAVVIAGPLHASCKIDWWVVVVNVYPCCFDNFHQLCFLFRGLAMDNKKIIVGNKWGIGKKCGWVWMDFFPHTHPNS